MSWSQYGYPDALSLKSKAEAIAPLMMAAAERGLISSADLTLRRAEELCHLLERSLISSGDSWSHYYNVSSLSELRTREDFSGDSSRRIRDVFAALGEEKLSALFSYLPAEYFLQRYRALRKLRFAGYSAVVHWQYRDGSGTTAQEAYRNMQSAEWVEELSCSDEPTIMAYMSDDPYHQRAYCISFRNVELHLFTSSETYRADPVEGLPCAYLYQTTTDNLHYTDHVLSGTVPAGKILPVTPAGQEYACTQDDENVIIRVPACIAVDRESSYAFSCTDGE